MNLADYTYIRHELVARHDCADEIQWAQNVKPPTTAAEFFGEAMWVVCCSGFKEQRARVTQEAVDRALSRGESATTVFPKSGKGRAIDALWANQQTYFEHFRRLIDSGASPGSIISWISTLPYIGGPILRYHFAKNMGVDVAKPDIHLERLAKFYKTTSQELCERLAAKTGDRIATVDVVIWRACNLGLINSRDPLSSGLNPNSEVEAA